MTFGKKISELQTANSFSGQDLIPIVQDQINKKLDGTTLFGEIGVVFASRDDVAKLEGDIQTITEGNVTDYTNLVKMITDGDNLVRNDSTAALNSYYDVLNNAIVELRLQHTADVLALQNTLQSWVNTIDDKSTKEELQQLINRLTVSENLLTSLAEIVAELSSSGGSGGGGGGYHTQSTNTIYPLTGYYKTGNTEPLRVTDTLNQALGKLESKVDAVTGSGAGSLPIIKTGEYTTPTDGNIYTAAKVKEEYLSKRYDDTAQGYIKFLKGLQGGDVFRKGFMGEGSSLYKEGSKWFFEVDNLFVRGQMTVNELIVNQIKAVGGEILVSAADMKATQVVEYSGYYRVYMDNDKDNQFVTLDQAICQKFDGTNVKRYWRLVTNVGTDAIGKFIDLSKTDCEPGSGIPEAGDEILQLGNRADAERRSAIFISSKGSAGPNITFYENITEYSLEQKDRTSIGRNSKFVGTLAAIASNGDIVQVPIDRGAYVPGTTYAYYDRVSHGGSLWLCMAITTTEAPSKDKPEIWLLQVEKGDAGSSASDVAVWVSIVGERIFKYDNPEFTGIPVPSELGLTCNTYGLGDGLQYEWKIKETGQIISHEPYAGVLPERFGENRSINLRCTVTHNSATYYDEVQLVKLGDGENGEDAYYIDFSNGTITVPYDSSGTYPLVPMSEVYSDIAVYKGTEQRVIQYITYEVIDGDGIAVLSEDYTRFSITTLSTNLVRFRLTVYADNLTFTKDIVVVKSVNGADGESGFDGVDASWVMLTGENIFRYNTNDQLISPETITLIATAYNISNPVFSWYWSPAGQNVWTKIEDEATAQYVVNPLDGPMMAHREVSYKVVCRHAEGSIEYSDILTISKLMDGINGESALTGKLSNEAHTVPANYSGAVSIDDIAKVTTDVELYDGKEKAKNYMVRWIVADPTDTVSALSPTTISVTEGSGNKRFTLSALNGTLDTVVFKIEFIIGAEVVDVKDLTVTKARGGKPGDFDVSLYAYKNTTSMVRPTLGKISVPTSAGVYDSANGVTWKLDMPSGQPIWMTRATFTLNEDGSVTSKPIDGYYWSLPIIVSGKNGTDGATGPQGPQGPAGANGIDGAKGDIGQVMNFRGEWDNTKSYYLDEYRADAVYYAPNSTYYRRYGTYYNSVGGSVPPTNSTYWRAYTGSFESLATGLLLATEADIAGWKFYKNFIYSHSGNAVLDGQSTGELTMRIGVGPGLVSGGTIDSAKAKFKVLDNGAMYATNATITGSVTATSGAIGGMTIVADSIYVDKTFTFMGYTYRSRARMGIPTGNSSPFDSKRSVFYSSFSFGMSGSSFSDCKYGVYSACDGFGAAAIYTSDRSSGGREPGGSGGGFLTGGFALYVDGRSFFRDYSYPESSPYTTPTNAYGLASSLVAARTYRWIASNPVFDSSDRYTYINGISFNQTWDLDSVRLVVRRGIVIGLTHDGGSPIYGTLGSNTNLGWQDSES